MTHQTPFRSAIARIRPFEIVKLTAVCVTDLTYRFDRLRSIPTEVLDSAGATFLLLIAVQAFPAGSTEKALIAAGGSLSTAYLNVV
jgi:hypothetical protein